MTSETLWYAGQATGIVALVLFTIVTVLGTLVAGKVPVPGLPRFGTLGVHRAVSMLAMVFLTIHVATSVVDSYVDISPLAAVIPFASSYDTLWTGVGTVAIDLLLAVAITSLLRAKIGRRTWKAVHLLAYAMWPIAVLHGYEMSAGKGSPMTGWTLWLTIACVLAVLAAIGLRLANRAGRLTPELVLSRSSVATKTGTSARSTRKPVSVSAGKGA